MTVDEFQKLLREKPHKAEEFLQRPDCPPEFKWLYLNEDDELGDKKNAPDEGREEEYIHDFKRKTVTRQFHDGRNCAA